MTISQSKLSHSVQCWSAEVPEVPELLVWLLHSSAFGATGISFTWSMHRMEIEKSFKSLFVTQLKLYTLYKLRSSIFCCLSVCQGSVSPDQISSFSNIFRHISPMLTLYHIISNSTSLYWPSTNKYQPVSPYTDTVPAGITYNLSSRRAQLNNFSFYDSFDESCTVYFV